MNRIPVACTLNATDARVRLAEWRTLFERAVTHVEVDQRVARLHLDPADEVLLATADLARREKACCGFFDFRLLPLADALVLEVEVPADAAAVLGDLVDLVPSRAR